MNPDMSSGKRSLFAGSRVLTSVVLVAAALLTVATGVTAKAPPPEALPQPALLDHDPNSLTGAWWFGSYAAQAMIDYDGYLTVAGGFNRGDGNSTGGAAFWDGTNWMSSADQQSGQLEGWALSLAEYQGSLIVSGHLSGCGGNPLGNTAILDDGAWVPLTGGDTNGEVWALTVFDDHLIAGGQFSLAGAQAANNVAMWDGSVWSPIGVGLNGPVYSLTVHDGELIAGGGFLYAGITQVNHIARWDGSSWQPIGTGFDGNVLALTTYNGQLVAGGTFRNSGSTAARRIAAYDGSTWNPFGAGTDNVVFALHEHQGRLIVGGSFTMAGGRTARRVAAWNGSSWSTIGMGMNIVVFSLHTHNGQLYAAGGFTIADYNPTKRIAIWNNLQGEWQPLRTGLDYLACPPEEGYQPRTYSAIRAFDAALSFEASPVIDGAANEPSANGDSHGLISAGSGLKVAYQNDGRLTFSFAMETAGAVQMDLWDVTGRRAARIVEAQLGAGPHELSWDPASSQASLPTGIYFARLTGPAGTSTARVVLTR